MRKKSRSISFYLSICVVIILATMGYVWTFSLAFGVSFIYVSIICLLSLRLLGLTGGLIVTITSHILALFLLENASLLLFILHVTEVLFIFYFLRQNKQNIIFLDLLFWFMIGAPIILLSEHFIQGLSYTETALIILKATINGVFNALIVDILYSYVPWKKIINTSHVREERTYQLSQLLYHLTIMSVLMPALILMVMESRYAEDKVTEEISSLMESKAFTISEGLSNWNDLQIQRVFLQSIIEMGFLKELVESNSLEGELTITILDDRDKVIVSNRHDVNFQDELSWKEYGEFTPLARNFYKWLPDKEIPATQIQYWHDGLFVYEAPLNNRLPWKIVIDTSVVPYQISFYMEYLNRFLVMLLFTVVVFLLAFVVKSSLGKTLLMLAATTTNLPRKIKEHHQIEWPQSKIYEFNSLINNFKGTSEDLSTMFHEAELMNSKLIEQKESIQKSQAQLNKLAYFDVLTKLPNRHHFNNHLKYLISMSMESNSYFYLMFIDLDRFKQINDTLGHTIGDNLLQKVAERLQATLDKDCFLARIGGDEFVLISTYTEETKQKIIDMADLTLQYISKPFQMDNQELFISASIGISLYPFDGVDEDTLFKNSDIAMYAAKEAGGDQYIFYSQTMDKFVSERMLLENNLRKALEGDEFYLVYQPKLDVTKNKIVSMEALIRWQNPILGNVPPDKFIPLAEDIGLIDTLGEWVLLKACQQNKLWQESGYDPLRIAVNVSTRQINNPIFVEKVAQILDFTGLEPQYVEIEITEGVMMKNTSITMEQLQKLKSLGIHVSMDDFGTGYSSLAQLKNFPIDTIKIDRSFIHNITSEPVNGTIVQAIIDIAHQLKINIVAEGVETKEELSYLEELKCDQIQGYYISKPLPSDLFEQMILDEFIYNRKIK